MVENILTSADNFFYLFDRKCKSFQILFNGSSQYCIFFKIALIRMFPAIQDLCLKIFENESPENRGEGFGPSYSTYFKRTTAVPHTITTQHALNMWSNRKGCTPPVDFLGIHFQRSPNTNLGMLETFWLTKFYENARQ